jgi:hypothetical protein
MRIIIIVICILGLAACSGKKTVAKNEGPAPAVEQVQPVGVNPSTVTGLEEFLQKFESSTKLHDKSAMMTLFDPEYKVRRHDRELKGNTDKFLDSFFCNYRTDGQGYICIKFNEITEAKRIEVIPNGSNYSVIYNISGKEATIKSYYLVLSRREGGKTVYGFSGAGA